MDQGIRNPVLRILVYGHVWLAVGAAVQTAWMQELLGLSGWHAPVLAFCGTIVGYTVRLRPDALPQGISAWMSVAVEGNETRAVIASLLGEPGVAALHDTNGRWDLLAQLRAENLAELSRVLERVRLVRGIRSTETSIHLETYRVA